MIWRLFRKRFHCLCVLSSISKFLLTPGLLYCKQHVMCVNNRIETNYLIWQTFHIPLYYINEIDQQIFMFCHPESQIVKKNQHIPRHIHTLQIIQRTVLGLTPPEAGHGCQRYFEKVIKQRIFQTIIILYEIIRKYFSAERFSTCSIFQLYHGGKFYLWRKPEYPRETTDLPLVTNKLSHNVVSSTPRHE
jgi:hypothetical protein